jgi:hypothetical protein
MRSFDGEWVVGRCFDGFGILMCERADVLVC